MMNILVAEFAGTERTRPRVVQTLDGSEHTEYYVGDIHVSRVPTE